MVSTIVSTEITTKPTRQILRTASVAVRGARDVPLEGTREGGRAARRPTRRHDVLSRLPLAQEVPSGPRRNNWVGAMKKIIAVGCIGLVSVVGISAPADAAVKTFANCTAMHKQFKGGVAKPGAKDKRASGHAKYAPYRSTAWYTANSKMDRDKDGIACEQ